MTSSIDPQYPVAGDATTQSVRDNFQYSKDEIEALQTQADQAILDIGALYTTDNQLLDLLQSQTREQVVPLPVLPTGLKRVINSANCAALANLACTANRVYWIPFRFKEAYYVGTVSIEVVTAVAGSGYCAIYNNEMGNGYSEPGPLNSLAPETADMGATGVFDFSLNTTLVANELYWIAFKATSAATIRGLPIAANANPLGHVPAGNNACSAFWRTYSAGPMPDPAAYTTNGTGTVPALFFEPLY